MVHRTNENDPQMSDTWGRKLGSEEMVTLTKAQLQALLNALGDHDPASIGNHIKINDLPRRESKIAPSEDENLPNWVRRNSMACPPSPGSVVTSDASQLEDMQRSRLSSSHPELAPNSRPFSKVAQKQLQWQRERAEMQDWYPWGRPGAGAPRRQPVAAVPPRTETQVLRVEGTGTFSAGVYSVPTTTPPPITQPLLPTNQSPAFVRRVPPALRSSVPFGPASDLHEDEKDKVKRRWLQDLERQREEQQRRRMLEQQRSSISNASWWGDNESTVGSTDTAAHRGDSDSATFACGPGTVCLDERRQKALEYQRAIQAQVEEKKRRKNEEREMRLREEREEELRLEEERRQLAQQYELEQKRQREKAEQEEKKRQMLIAKVQEAQAEAEAMRKARRGQRLQQQVAVTQASGSSAPAGGTGLIAEDSGIASSSGSLKTPPSTTQVTTATVHPMQNSCRASSSSSQLPTSNCISPSQRDTCSQTERGLSSDVDSRLQSPRERFPKFEPYIENRVLTPTKLRIVQRSRRHLTARPPGREFGTQTDISLPSGWGAGVENPSTSTASSAQSTTPQQKTHRVQHSRPTRVVRNPEPADRPQWGANNPDRVFVKMTDRDPNYHRRKKLQEMRKQHWEREMASRRPLRNAGRQTPSSSCVAHHDHSSRGTSGEQGRGRSSSHSPSRSFPSSHTQRTLSSERLHSMEDSAEEDDDDPNRTVVLRRAPSPPVPALRKQLVMQGDESLLAPPSGNSSWALPRTPSHSENEAKSPPARKRWQNQKVYVPLSSSSPPLSSRNGDHVVIIEKRGRSARRGSAGRHRSVSVHGCRPTNPSPYSPLESPHVRSSSQDPLVHPEVITGRPTPRQDKILQQLSSLRQGLLLKQREMENILRKSKT
ncbi:coiled-coil domain-containing protein 66-like [Ornithodoros turicata]|uniref:coiled-coil domain-containing protein 66-like n=1 Tax=Ornithodoros turicata TaxID=34597 RepID=UPI003138B872